MCWVLLLLLANLIIASLLGGTTAANISSLQHAQNSLGRAIYRLPSKIQTTSYLSQLNKLPIMERINLGWHYCHGKHLISNNQCTCLSLLTVVIAAHVLIMTMVHSIQKVLLRELENVHFVYVHCAFGAPSHKPLHRLLL